MEVIHENRKNDIMSKLETSEMNIKKFKDKQMADQKMKIEMDRLKREEKDAKIRRLQKIKEFEI